MKNTSNKDNTFLAGVHTSEYIIFLFVIRVTIRKFFCKSVLGQNSSYLWSQCVQVKETRQENLLWWIVPDDEWRDKNETGLRDKAKLNSGYECFTKIRSNKQERWKINTCDIIQVLHKIFCLSEHRLLTSYFPVILPRRGVINHTLMDALLTCD